MKVKMKGRDGGVVVCYIRSENFDPNRMERLEGGLYERTTKGNQGTDIKTA